MVCEGRSWKCIEIISEYKNIVMLFLTGQDIELGSDNLNVDVHYTKSTATPLYEYGRQVLQHLDILINR